jgi:hypothetical protein
MQEDSTAMAAAGGKKKMLATLVGCNYAGVEGIQLRGCINDVHAMCAVLLDRFGFAPGDVTVLTDDDPKKLPTRDAIKGALDDMVKRAAPRDVLFFHFSGHGMRSDYADGPGGCADEIIVACDFKIITGPGSTPMHAWRVVVVISFLASD